MTGFQSLVDVNGVKRELMDYKTILAGPVSIYKPGMYSWEIKKTTFGNIDSFAKVVSFSWIILKEGEVLWGGQKNSLRDAYEEIIFHLNALQYGLPSSVDYDNVIIKGTI
jgi:hypothetical protein